MRTEGLPILTFWETVVAILSSQPAVAPATGTATRSVPKQSFYRPLPSPASQIHSRGSLVRGGGSSGSLFSIAGELMEITPFRFDHVDNFLAVREFCSPVNLIIADDNEATIKILLKGRSIKLRHVHRTHGVNLDWLYEIFYRTSCRCRLRYVSTKHQFADIHIKAITKADVWTHLTRVSSLHSVQAGSHQRAKSFCIGILTTSTAMMSSSSAFIGPGDYVHVCPACKYVEEDVSKLRINTGVGATIMLCCAKCTLFTEVKPVSRSQHFSTGSTMASPLPLKLSPTRERTPSPIPPPTALVNKQ